MTSALDCCRFTATSAGTVDFVVSAAVGGYQTPASAGAVNATVYRYRAESADLTQWEVGFGAYTTASSTLARTTVLFNSAGTTSKISFTNPPQVAITFLAEDLPAGAIVGTTDSQALTNKTINGLTVTATSGTLTISGSKSLTMSNSLTLAGTDATTMTFPSTSATIARTDAAQTLAGTQTFSGIIASSSSPANGAQFDTSSAAKLSCTTGSNATLTNIPTSGAILIMVRDTSVSGHSAVYLLSTATSILIATSASTVWVAATKTPGAGLSSVAYDGTANFRIYNNSGSTINYAVLALRAS